MVKKSSSSGVAALAAAAKKKMASSAVPRDGPIPQIKAKRRPASYASYIKRIAQKREMAGGKKASITDPALESIDSAIQIFISDLGLKADWLSLMKKTKTVGHKQIVLAADLFFAKADLKTPKGEKSIKHRALEFIADRCAEYKASVAASKSK